MPFALLVEGAAGDGVPAASPAGEAGGASGSAPRPAPASAAVPAPLVSRAAAAVPAAAATPAPASGGAQRSLFDLLDEGAPEKTPRVPAGGMRAPGDGPTGATRAPGAAAPAGQAGVTTPTVLRGVIDLVYRTPDGWRIIDYKTDVIVADVRELVARYGGQVQRYREAWMAVTHEPAAGAGLFSVRRLDTAWME